MKYAQRVSVTPRRPGLDVLSASSTSISRFAVDAAGRSRSLSKRRIEDQDIIDKILAHLRDKDPTSSTLPLLIPPSRAPPRPCLFSPGRARGSRFQSNCTQPSRKPVETVWHELLRAVVQDWTDMNGMPNTVNRVFGSISANFSRSTSPVDSISEGVYSQQGLYISLYLNPRGVLTSTVSCSWPR